MQSLDYVRPSKGVDKINECQRERVGELYLATKLITLYFGYLFRRAKKFFCLTDKVAKAVPPLFNIVVLSFRKHVLDARKLILRLLLLRRGQPTFFYLGLFDRLVCRSEIP